MVFENHPKNQPGGSQKTSHVLFCLLKKESCGKDAQKATKQLCFCRTLSPFVVGELLPEERSEIWALIGAWVRNTSSDLDVQMWGCVDAWCGVKGLRGGLVIPRIFPRIL